jgi:hypothetical protein
MKSGRLICGLLAFLWMVGAASAVETAFWQVGSYDEFLQGTLTGISVSNEGDLRLAPEAKVIFSPDEAVSLGLAKDSQGNIYLGTGHQGKVFKVAPDHKSTLLLTANEPDIFALAVGPDGNLYAGSSPDGKVYKVTPDGKSSVFYDPKAKYIWALEFDAQGKLYVATGDLGQIYRVDPSGKGELFYDSKQSHIMCLRFDHAGNLLAGSEPNGLIYRISPQGKAFVIYQAGLPEVHDLAIDSEGRIFAATLGGAGSKGSQDLLLAPPQTGAGTGVTTITVTASSSSEGTAKGQTPAPTTKNPSFNRFIPQVLAATQLQLGNGRGALIEIMPDSSVETRWSSNNESIFGLAIRGEDVLFTTDSNGRIFDLATSPDSNKMTIITETHEALTTRLLVAGDDVYAATSNAATLVQVNGAPAHEGTYVSEVKDSKFISHWGVLAWRGDVPKGCSLNFFTRSGNSERPDSTWSDWSGPYSDPDGTAITSVPGRYMQWKAVLDGSDGATPTLDEVTLSYLNQNLPPQIHSLNVSASSERTGNSASSQISSAISVSSVQGITYNLSSATSPPAKAPIAIGWQADDPNGDTLIYSLYLKSTDEQEWHLLKDKLTLPAYAIDPASLPDGKYVARLVASDELSNPPALARKAELLSAPFWVDNTPPDVEVIRQTVNGDSVEVQFSAEDDTSPLRGAETSTDADDWHDIYSDDGIVDSRRETFTVKLTHLSPGEHVLALRASDTSGNIGVGKAVIHIPSATR